VRDPTTTDGVGLTLEGHFEAPCLSVASHELGSRLCGHSSPMTGARNLSMTRVVSKYLERSIEEDPVWKIELKSPITE
jgi:hypothetical protein